MSGDLSSKTPYIAFNLLQSLTKLFRSTKKTSPESGVDSGVQLDPNNDWGRGERGKGINFIQIRIIGETNFRIGLNIFCG